MQDVLGRAQQAIFEFPAHYAHLPRRHSKHDAGWLGKHSNAVAPADSCHTPAAGPQLQLPRLRLAMRSGGPQLPRLPMRNPPGVGVLAWME